VQSVVVISAPRNALFLEDAMHARCYVAVTGA
jgi:hypothetical protein